MQILAVTHAGEPPEAMPIWARLVLAELRVPFCTVTAWEPRSTSYGYAVTAAASIVLSRPGICNCDEPGFDPYECDAADCTSFNSLVGGGPGPRLGGWGTPTTKRCPKCPWSTTWQISDGSAEADLHRHMTTAHPAS